MKRAYHWLRERIVIWLAALTLALLMSHEPVLIDDGAETVAADVRDAQQQAAQNAKATEVGP